MSDTPRVDAALEWAHWNGQDVQMVPYDFARQLERELAEVRTILAGTDYGSLPNDFHTIRMAAERMGELEVFRNDAAVSASGRSDLADRLRQFAHRFNNELLDDDFADMDMKLLNDCADALFERKGRT